MQLKKENSILAALASGAAALMGVSPSPAAAEIPVWQVDTGVTSYVEMGDRITVVEFAGAAKTELSEDTALKLKVTVDTVTGASPNGATPSTRVQTFTSPSGNTEYQATSGKAPLDPTFRDTRVGGSVTWEQGLTSTLKWNVGAQLARETDHFSAGLNTGLSLDLNNRNTTLFAGVSGEADTVNPINGIPVSMITTGPKVVKHSIKSKDTYSLGDALVGVTQTLSRRAIAQVNFSHSQSSGYLSNPYKVLSLVDGSTGETLDYVFEKRPDTRTKESVYFRLKYSFDQDAVDLAYRHMWDSWKITSHTVEFKYYWILPSGDRLEPALRYYTQTEADLYHTSLVFSEYLPKYASADTRLAKFDAISAGLKYAMRFYGKSELGFKLEYYAQKGIDKPSNAIGSQKGMDLFPELSAVVAQVTWGF